MKNLCIEKQLITRQYTDKWKFMDYKMLFKKMQCNHIFSFCGYPIDTSLYNFDGPISTCKFSNKHKDILAVANENGEVCIQNVKKIKDCTFIQTHKNTVYDIAWMPDNSKFVTVSGDNSAKLWDCEASNVSLISVFRGHKRSVKCVSFKPENSSIFATGCRDGSLMIWDTRAQKKCASVSHHLPDQVILSGAGSSYNRTKLGTRKPNYSISKVENCKSVTGLVFQNDNTLISCGSLDNIIRVWDMRKTYSRSTSNSVAKYQLCSPYSAFSYLCTNTMRTQLYANCMDSYIYCFNINSYHPEPVAAFYGHENGSFYIKSSISFDGNFLMSGSSNQSAYIWNTTGAELSEVAVKPFLTLNSHLAEVTCVEMCPDNMVIVTCSDDGSFRLWNTSVYAEDDAKVDRATGYDMDNVTTVKTQWKNKRKFDNLEDNDAKQPKSNGSSTHSKICRFYTKNLSSSCICHARCTHKNGIKRSSEETLVEMNPAKKKNFFAGQENIQPKQEKSKSSAGVEYNTTPKKLIPTPLKLSSKRKLEDPPDCMEETNKKINCKRILVSFNAVEDNDENKNIHQEVEPSRKFQKATSETPEKKGQETKCLSDPGKSKEILLGFPSPTCNLPNYIEDGTSPYIHRCPKINHRENDWLTKLKEAHKTAKMSENKKPTSGILTSLSQKKKMKNGGHTLHQYFKVSSKTMEKNFNLPEYQKKSISTK